LHVRAWCSAFSLHQTARLHSLKSKTPTAREAHHSSPGRGLLDNDPLPNDEKVLACNKPNQQMK
ncbi:MAG TPA: hypothetical protein VJS86_11915, partial [Arthrobacter sp.]|nr:hypothetical protein [Arthrobacter sp.]